MDKRIVVKNGLLAALYPDDYRMEDDAELDPYVAYVSDLNIKLIAREMNKDGWLTPTDPLSLSREDLTEVIEMLGIASGLFEHIYAPPTFNEYVGGFNSTSRFVRLLNALKSELQVIEAGVPSKVITVPKGKAIKGRNRQSNHPFAKHMPRYLAAAEDALNQVETRTSARKRLRQYLKDNGVQRTERTLKKYSEEEPPAARKRISAAITDMAQQSFTFQMAKAENPALLEVDDIENAQLIPIEKIPAEHVMKSAAIFLAHSVIRSKGE